MATDIRASVHSPDSDLGTSEKNPSPKSDHHLATWESLCLDRSVSPMERSITPMSPRSQSASSTSPRRGGMSSDGASPRLSGRDLERFDSKGSVRRRNSLSLNSDFIKSRSKLNMSVDSSRSFKERVQHVARRILNSSYVSNFMVLVVLFDAYCTCSDIDARAQGGKAPALVLTLSDVCLTLYTIELVLNFAVQGKRMATDWTLLLDMFIVAFGYVDLILSTVLEEDIVLRMGVLRVFRLARIVRLMRLLRKTRALRELQKLVTMMATCLRALAWSFVFCFLIMTVWAMFIVEVVNPLVQDLNTESGVFQDCPQCLRATQSVMEANLLLFKTVIAGDGWGLIAVPVIEKYPATAVIFVGSLLTLVFGVLNLIVAVVVDTFAEARQRDILNLAEELEFDDEKDRKFLQAVFDRIDRRGSGKISLEELVEGARRDQEFQSRLRVMDIDESDLQQLFQMIDTTREGFISAPEFIAPLSRWVHDSKTAPRFIKYNLQTLRSNVELVQLSGLYVYIMYIHIYIYIYVYYVYTHHTSNLFQAALVDRGGLGVSVGSIEKSTNQLLFNGECFSDSVF
ncbi:unnamed protein product [Effrenium voratum]|nr:unnamed protein product [Effrenium voratum]